MIDSLIYIEEKISFETYIMSLNSIKKLDERIKNLLKTRESLIDYMFEKRDKMREDVLKSVEKGETYIKEIVRSYDQIFYFNNNEIKNIDRILDELRNDFINVNRKIQRYENHPCLDKII